jgi:hypothetical protein
MRRYQNDSVSTRRSHALPIPIGRRIASRSETARSRRLVREINHPNVAGDAHADFFPFRRQHVFAMTRGIDPFAQNKLGPAAG